LDVHNRFVDGQRCAFGPPVLEVVLADGGAQLGDGGFVVGSVELESDGTDPLPHGVGGPYSLTASWALPASPAR
jgi:hypothetical protein